MDGISEKRTVGGFQIRYQIDSTSVPKPKTKLLDLVLQVSGDIEVEVEGKIIYSEVEFPLLELAYHLNNWLNRNQVCGEFCFNSVFSDDEGLIRFYFRNNHWNADFSGMGLFDQPLCGTEEIEKSVIAYIEELIKDLDRDFSLDVTGIISGQFSM